MFEDYKDKILLGIASLFWTFIGIVLIGAIIGVVVNFLKIAIVVILIALVFYVVGHILYKKGYRPV